MRWRENSTVRQRMQLRQDIKMVIKNTKEDYLRKMDEFNSKFNKKGLDFFNKVQLLQRRIDTEMMLFLVKDAQNFNN